MHLQIIIKQQPQCCRERISLPMIRKLVAHRSRPDYQSLEDAKIPGPLRPKTVTFMSFLNFFYPQRRKDTKIPINFPKK